MADKVLVSRILLKEGGGQGGRVDLQHVVAVRQEVGVAHVGALHQVPLRLQIRSERSTDGAANACRARHITHTHNVCNKSGEVGLDNADVWQQQNGEIGLENVNVW